MFITPNNLITGFASRLAAVFDEYCITGALFEIRVVHRAGPAQGLVYVYMDEKDFGAPSASEANCVPRLEALIHNAAMPVLHHVSWKASDVADLEWRSTTTAATYAPAALKLFATSADTGTSATTDCVVYVTGALNIDVRGWRGN